MVICKYFQNGNCKFGTKCMNEHFDIKPIIKTEVEAAIKGSQWPLSCFGPFKEKPSIPNFIEDQSFEEVRLQCYEARKQNCFPAFHQQFSQQVIDSQNKMKALLSLNRDVIDVLTNLYNSGEAPKKPVTHHQNLGGNPFSLNNSNANSTTNLFGNKSSIQSNPFSNPGSGISLFGNNSTAANTNSIFGNQNATSTTNPGSILSQSSFGLAFGNTQTSGGGGSLFGQQQQNTFGQTSGNLFGIQQQPNPIINSNQQSTFGGASGGSIFGNPSQSTVVFGQPQQQQPQNLSMSASGTASGLFGNQMQSSSSFGSFGQPQQSPPFGMQQTNTSNSLFNQQQQTNQGGIFGSVQQQQPQQQSIFSQAQQQPPPNFQHQITPVSFQNSQQNLFGNQQQLSSPPAFGVQTNNTQPAINFGSVQQPFQQQQQQSQQIQGGNLFGLIQQSQNNFQQTTAGANFQNQQQFNTTSANIFNNNNDIPFSENFYSKMDTLKTEEIEAFKADKFEIGKIPTNPPPRELI